MKSAGKKSQACSSCKKRSATEHYMRVTPEETTIEMVCESCFDFLEMREEYENKRRGDVAHLEINGQYEEAINTLSSLLATNTHRDHDTWLARRIAADRAMILLDVDQYAKAEAACEDWEDLGFNDVGDRWMHGSVQAKALAELGRPREGLEVLERALSYRDPRHIPAALGHLRRLVEISEKLGQPVDSKWRSLAEESGKWYGVEMPKHESLGKAILELDNAVRKRKATH